MVINPEIGICNFEIYVIFCFFFQEECFRSIIILQKSFSLSGGTYISLTSLANSHHVFIHFKSATNNLRSKRRKKNSVEDRSKISIFLLYYTWTCSCHVHSQGCQDLPLQLWFHRLDLYLPENSDGPKPVVAFVTGGAWIIGWEIKLAFSSWYTIYYSLFWYIATDQRILCT